MTPWLEGRSAAVGAHERLAHKRHSVKNLSVWELEGTPVRVKNMLEEQNNLNVDCTMNTKQKVI